MTIRTLYRVECAACGRYLQSDYRKPTEIAKYASLFPTFSAAYDEAVRRGWTAFPLLCKPCGQELRKKVTDGEVPGTVPPVENGGGVPESDQGPERAGRDG